MNSGKVNDFVQFVKQNRKNQIQQCYKSNTNMLQYRNMFV